MVAVSTMLKPPNWYHFHVFFQSLQKRCENIAAACSCSCSEKGPFAM